MTIFAVQNPRNNWASVCTITGDSDLGGEAGPQGSQGPRGVQGTTGDQGSQGSQGPQGSSTSSILPPPFGPLPVASVSASSNSGSASNLLSAGATDWWMSALDSENYEWVEYQFAMPSLITGVYLHCAEGRQGTPIIEGYDGDVWIPLTSLNSIDFQSSIVAGQSFIYKPITDTRLYSTVRIISSPTPYLMYYYFVLFGAPSGIVLT